MIWLSLFAVTMAHVEAALVVYLRTVYYPDNLLALFPLSLLSERDLAIELVRELATLVMILSVALLTAKGFARVFAVFAYTFGLWDISYYVWLKIMIGWPVTWSEWDVLFLIPWPWLAPWITPALVALSLVFWSAWGLLSPRPMQLGAPSVVLFVLGALLVLVSFLSPAAPLLAADEEAWRAFEPSGFSWGTYLVGLVTMSLGLWHLVIGLGDLNKR